MKGKETWLTFYTLKADAYNKLKNEFKTKDQFLDYLRVQQKKMVTEGPGWQYEFNSETATKEQDEFTRNLLNKSFEKLISIGDQSNCENYKDKGQLMPEFDGLTDIDILYYVKKPNAYGIGLKLGTIVEMPYYVLLKMKNGLNWVKIVPAVSTFLGDKTIESNIEQGYWAVVGVEKTKVNDENLQLFEQKTKSINLTK